MVKRRRVPSEFFKSHGHALSPHFAHTSSDIETQAVVPACYYRFGGCIWPPRPFEEAHQTVGDEPRTSGINMPITLGVLTMCEKALRNDEVETSLARVIAT